MTATASARGATRERPTDPYPLPDLSAFAGQDYIAAPELTDLARRLSPLGIDRIDFLWKRGGGPAAVARLARCQRPRGLLRHYALAERADFVVWVSVAEAHRRKLSRFEMAALIFHQVCHAGTDASGRPAIQPHDFVGAFRTELSLYGLWRLSAWQRNQVLHALAPKGPRRAARTRRPREHAPRASRNGAKRR